MTQSDTIATNTRDRFRCMIRKLLVLASLGAALIAASPPNAKQMASLNYLVGTWHCAWSDGKQSGSEDQIFSVALGGAWLEEKEVVSMNGQPFVRSIHYTGYDPAKREFLHVGPDANGTYELAESADTNTWTSADGKFLHTKVSDTERKMNEGPIAMTCTKE